MESIEVLKGKLNPEAIYLMKNGPFGDNTLLVVVNEEPEDLEKILDEIELDYDFAIVTKEEFESIREVVEESGEKLW